MKSEDGTFNKTFNNQGAGGDWDYTSGHVFDNFNTAEDKIPTGRYTINQRHRDWNVSNDILKKMTFGFSSSSPIVLTQLTQA